MNSDIWALSAVLAVPALLIGACLLVTRRRGDGLRGTAEATAGRRAEAEMTARIVRSAGPGLPM